MKIFTFIIVNTILAPVTIFVAAAVVVGLICGAGDQMKGVAKDL